MRLMSMLIACLLVSAAPLAVAQQESAPAPRATALAVAQQVEDNFFNEARGKEIADGLRARAEHGDYDRFTNPVDLATALTNYLHPFDGHFAVVYRTAGQAPLPGAPGPRQGPPGPQGAQGPAARGNYGFSKVEILPGGIGYVRIDSFAGFDPRGPATQPARRAADAAIAMVSGARAIILDLRDSRGGSPAMVAYLASYFVPAGADIFNTFHSRRGDASEAPVIDPTGERRLETPLYILVNGGAGSASESFPYTLQSAHRATIVGEPTNGRANPGGFVPVAGGFAVFVSSGTPENPITHTNWEGAGIQPDVRVASTEALTRVQELALQQLLAADPQGEAAAETRWALEALQTPTQTLGATALALYAGAYGEVRFEVADGALLMRNGRRMAVLAPIGPDLFRGSATQRVQFERANGRIVAATVLGPMGPMQRLTRD